MLNTVVVVDDKAMMRQALCRLFSSAGGFQICGEAANGQDALKLASTLRPDLIVLDLCMPGMNGLETAQELKNLTLPTRVILYSLNAEDMLIAQALASGVAAVVSKAEGVQTLITKARTILKESAA